MNSFKICVVVVTCCFLTASAKPTSLSTSYTLAEYDPASDCGKASSGNAISDNSLYKFAGFQSNVNHDIPITYQYAPGIKYIGAEPATRMPAAPVQHIPSRYITVTEAPILRTAEIEPARIFAAAPAVNPLLESRIIAKTLLKINSPVATSMQMMNKYEDAPAPAYLEAPRIVPKYVTEAPILRTAEIEPARILTAAPITNQLLESRTIGEPLLKINHPVATSMQMMNKYEDAPAPALWEAPRIASKYVTEAPILRNAEIEPARIFAAAPVVNPLLQSRIVAKPLLKINSPVATSMQMMNKYEDAPAPAYLEAPRIVPKYVTEAPILRTAEIEPARILTAAPISNQLLESRTISEPLLKINRPVATSMQMMNKYEDAPAPAYWEAPRTVSNYVTESPILRTAEIEPARIFAAAPVVNPLLESRIVAKPLLKINSPVATSMQTMNKYEDAPAPAYWEAPRTVSNYVTEAPILRTAEIEPARIFAPAPIAAAPISFPLLEKRIVAEPIIKINRPLAIQRTDLNGPSLWRVHPESFLKVQATSKININENRASAWQYSNIGLNKEDNLKNYVQTYGSQNKLPLAYLDNSAGMVPQYYSNAIIPKYYAPATVPQYYSSESEAADNKPC